MQIVAVYQVRLTEKSGSSAPTSQSWKVVVSMYKYLQTHWSSQTVSLRVPINNNNYEQPIALFIILAKNTFMNHHGVIYCWRQVDVTVATSINKCWRLIDPPIQWLRPLLLINVGAKSTCNATVVTYLINITTPSRPAYAMVETSIINKRWCQVNLLTRQSRPLLINLGAKLTRQRHGCDLY